MTLKITPLLVAAIILSLASCSSTNNEESTSHAKEGKTPITEDKTATSSDASISQIDQIRAEIETLDAEPLEISTENLRSKISQKWKKMHFYTHEGQLVKIKTYPHESVSDRTEEFYIQNNQLQLVVIEDDGSGEKGKPKQQLDKLYYFNDGKVFHEARGNEEKEYSEHQSDADELHTEFVEYLTIYQEQ